MGSIGPNPNGKGGDQVEVFFRPAFLRRDGGILGWQELKTVHDLPFPKEGLCGPKNACPRLSLQACCSRAFAAPLGGVLLPTLLVFSTKNRAEKCPEKKLGQAQKQLPF